MWMTDIEHSKWIFTALCCVTCGSASARTDTRDLSSISSGADAIVIGTVSSATKEGNHFALNVTEEGGACGEPGKKLDAPVAMTSETGAVSGGRYIFFLGTSDRYRSIDVMAKFRLAEGIRTNGGSVVVIDIDNHSLVPSDLPIHQLLQQREANNLDRETSMAAKPPIVVASYALLSDFCAALARNGPNK